MLFPNGLTSSSGGLDRRGWRPVITTQFGAIRAPAAPPREVIDSWVGTAPTGVQANGTATKRLWEPWQTGVTLEVTYVPRDHPLGTSYGIQGLVLVSQSIGGF